MNKSNEISKLVNIILKAIAVAMSVAVVVTNIMGVMEINSQVMLLGIGLFSLALTALDKE